MATPRNDREKSASDVFREHSADLLTAIQDPEVLAWELYAKKIIPSTVRDAASNTMHGTNVRTSVLLTAVESKILLVPETFDVFLSVLASRASMIELCKRMRAAYGEEDCLNQSMIGPQTPFEETPMEVAVAKRNRMFIGTKWGALVAYTDKVLQSKLDKNEITRNGFQLFLGNLYSCEGKMNGGQFLKKLLKSPADVSEMLKTLTAEGEWDFLNYHLLECIIEEYGDDRSRQEMEQYKQDLTGYTLATKIKDAVLDLQPPTGRILPIPPKELFSTLTTKTEGANITNHSLEYVRDLWESLKNQFSLPSHILVIYRIGKGCLEIVWHIPSELSDYIIQKAKESESYFKEQHFLRVSVEVQIYTKSEAGVHVKEMQLPVPHVKSIGAPLPVPLKSQTFDDSASTISSDSGLGIVKPLRAPHPHVRREFDDSASTISIDSGIEVEKRKRKGKVLTAMPPHVEQPIMSTEGSVKRKDTTSTLMPLPEHPSMSTEQSIKRKDTTSTLMPIPELLVKHVFDDSASTISSDNGLRTKKKGTREKRRHRKRKGKVLTAMPLPHAEQPSMSAEGSNKRTDSRPTLTMRWEKLKKAPQQMEGGATAVDGNTVYVNPACSHHVWRYDHDLKDDKWIRLPDCTQCCAGLEIVNGQLTAVGGITNDGSDTNTLLSLSDERWTQHFPPMPMKLSHPAVVCTGNHLVVVADSKTARIHVMDTTTRSWFVASSLPVYVSYPSLAVCGKQLYVLDYMRSVFFSCWLPSLLESSSAEQPETTDVWQRLANAPVGNSTLTTLCGQLIAVGGLKPIDTTHLYDPSTNSWHVTGRMPTARCRCLVATLRSDTLVVIGGFTGQRTTCDVVEVAHPS